MVYLFGNLHTLAGFTAIYVVLKDGFLFLSSGKKYGRRDEEPIGEGGVRGVYCFAIFPCILQGNLKFLSYPVCMFSPLLHLCLVVV